MRYGNRTREEISACEDEEAAQAQKAELTEQQQRRDEIVDDQRRLIDGNERRERRERPRGERRRDAEGDCRNGDYRESPPPFRSRCRSQRDRQCMLTAYAASQPPPPLFFFSACPREEQITDTALPCL